jgi:putative DNA primase/helicase
MSLTSLPRALRETDGWILHRGKRPLSPSTLGPCDPTKREGATAFETVLAVQQKHINLGPGFVLSDEDELVCVDIDKCYKDGVLDLEIQSLVDRTESYIEKSPSGNGLHIWVKGKKPGPLCRRGNIEMYDAQRYMTVTGERISAGLEVLADQALIDRVYRMIDTKPESSNSFHSIEIDSLDIDSTTEIDAETLAALHQEIGFQATWDKQREDQFPSPSEYEMSLANYGAMAELVPQQIADLLIHWRARHGFELKGHHEDYLIRTIEKAVDYANASKASSHRPLTDLGNAERFVDRHGTELIFVPELNQWWLWDEYRWTTLPPHQIHARVRSVTRTIHSEAADKPEDEAKRILRHGRNSEAVSRLNATTTLIKQDIHLVRSVTELDSDPGLLGVGNGVLDLDSGLILPPDRNQLITMQSAVMFDAEQECPRWLQFIDEITCDDQLLGAYLQRAVGYTLCGEITEQCFFFLVGAGCNGKSVFLEIVRELLGGYSCISAPETFMKRLGSSSSGPREDIVRLNGKRLVIVNELGEDERFNEVFLKQITGGDLLVGRIPHANKSVEFKPECKLWFAGNHQPYIYGVDTGIWRRIMLVPFSNDFSKQRDPDLVRTLRGEFSGVLNWALTGFQEWRKSGLNPPGVVQAATLQYREDMDVLQQFIEDECSRDPGSRISSSELYRGYQSWCMSSGLRTMSDRTFGKKLTAKGYESRKSNGIRYRIGLSFRPFEGEWPLLTSKPG